MTKICTDIKQSKKLIELGIDVNSADIHWQYIEEDNGQIQWFYFQKDFSINQKDSIPAWSLSALINILGFCTLDFSNSHYCRVHAKERFSEWYENGVDACVETILKLKEKNLL